MFALWALIWFVIVSVVMLVPMVFCLAYVIISLRQWSIGAKEKSEVKRKGALKALALSLGGLLLVILAWYYVITDL